MGKLKRFLHTNNRDSKREAYESSSHLQAFNQCTEFPITNCQAQEYANRNGPQSRKKGMVISSKTLHMQIIEELRTAAVLTQLQAHGLL